MGNGVPQFPRMYKSRHPLGTVDQSQVMLYGLMLSPWVGLKGLEKSGTTAGAVEFRGIPVPHTAVGAIKGAREVPRDGSPAIVSPLLCGLVFLRSW